MANRFTKWAVGNLAWMLLLKLLFWVAAAVTTYFFAILAYDSRLSYFWIVILGAATFYFIVNAGNKIVQATSKLLAWKKAREQGAAKPPSDEHPQTDADVKKIRESITELEEEKASLERKHKETVMGYERGYDDLKRDYDKLKKRLEDWEKYDWLVSLATVQANDIEDYVVVEQIRFCYHDFTAPIPFLIFGVDIRNKSVFDITIENVIEGHIRLAGEYLRAEKELIHNPKISPSGKESLTIKQRLSSV